MHDGTTCLISENEALTTPRTATLSAILTLYLVWPSRDLVPKTPTLLDGVERAGIQNPLFRGFGLEPMSYGVTDTILGGHHDEEERSLL